MGAPRGVGTIVAIAFLFLAVCNSHGRSAKDPLNFLKIPVDEGQRTLALDAVNGLRDAFNKGSCLSIYEQAAAHFRTQSLEEWMSQCKELEENLGSFQSFSASSVGRCSGGPPPIMVCLGGAARFAKGIKEVHVAWLLDNGRTQLMWIALKQNQGTWMQIPPWRGLQHPMFDTPPRALPKSDLAG
jgi:hypothetical protein